MRRKSNGCVAIVSAGLPHSCATNRWVQRTVGNAGNGDTAGVTKDRPGEGTEEGKAMIVLKVCAETMDSIAQA